MEWEELIIKQDEEGIKRYLSSLNQMERNQSEKMIIMTLKRDDTKVMNLIVDWIKENQWGIKEEDFHLLESSISNSFSLKRRNRNRNESSNKEENEMIKLILNKCSPSSIELNQSLLLSCSQSRLDILQLIVNHAEERKINLNFNVRDSENDNTPLLIATLYHNVQLQIVEYLLDHGADINATNRQKNNCLHRIASKPSINNSTFEVVEFLISRGIHVHSQNNQGDTPLIKSARQGNHSLTQLLLKYTDRGKLLIENNSGYNVIHEAAIWCQTGILQLIQDQYDDVMNCSNKNGDTPLHVAGDEGIVGPGFYRGGIKLSPINQTEAQSWMNNPNKDSIETNSALMQTVKILLSGGGSVHSLNRMNEMPLHNMRVPWEKTQIILSQFDDPFKAVISPNIQGKTPFQIAFELIKIEHIQNILREISGGNSSFKESPKVCQLMESVQSNPSSVEAVLRSSCTQESYFNLTETLLSMENVSCLINNADENGITPLHLAVSDNALQTVRLLLQLNADIDAKGSFPKQKTFDVDPKMIDKMMQVFGNDQTSGELKQSDFDVESKKTPLEMAVDNFAIESVIEIIKHKYNESSISKTSAEAKMIKGKYDSSGNNFLHKAVEIGNVESLVDLLEFVGMEPDSVGEDLGLYSDGGTPLYKAAQTDQHECAKALIDWKANVNSQTNVDSNTPLHVAARFGNFNSVRLLLERGADPSILNQENETPLEMAEYGGNKECIELLQSHIQ